MFPLRGLKNLNETDVAENSLYLSSLSKAISVPGGPFTIFSRSRICLDDSVAFSEWIPMYTLYADGLMDLEQKCKYVTMSDVIEDCTLYYISDITVSHRSRQ